jgi:hypothetical protein
MPAWHALPSWLKRHNYTSPAVSTDTSFAQGQRAPPTKSFFAWLKERPWNSNEFHLFMNVHRTGVRTWLDAPEVLKLIAEEVEKREAVDIEVGSPRSASEGSDSEVREVAFVDVGGGGGQQCMVCRKSRDCSLIGVSFFS